MHLGKLCNDYENSRAKTMKTAKKRIGVSKKKAVKGFFGFSVCFWNNFFAFSQAKNRGASSVCCEYCMAIKRLVLLLRWQFGN